MAAAMAAVRVAYVTRTGTFSVEAFDTFDDYLALRDEPARCYECNGTFDPADVWHNGSGTTTCMECVTVLRRREA